MKILYILSSTGLERLQIIALLLAIILIPSSCGDEHILNSINEEHQITTRSNVDDPVLQNGYLLFEDRDHLLKYYAYLEAVADTASELNDALLAVAMRLGHNSLLYTDTSAFSTPLAVASNFGRISDPIKRVILNSKQEVGIGDSLFVLQNRWETYSFPLTDIEMRDTLNATPKGTRVDVFKITPTTRLVDSDNLIITNRGSICFQYNKIFRANPCTDPLTVGVVAGATLFGFPYGFDMDINWGDGTSHTIDNTNWGDGKWDHTYSTSGTYTVVSTLNTSCAGPITFVAAGIISVGGECDGGDIDTSGWDDDDDIGMKMEAWSTKDIFGAHVGAKTTCFEKIGGSWRERRGEVSVNIDADFRDVECNIEDMDNETDDCGNCRSKRAVVTSSIHNRYHILGDATSTHSVDRGGVELTGSIILDYKCD